MKVAETWEFPTKEYVRCRDNSLEEIKLKFPVFKKGEFGKTVLDI